MKARWRTWLTPLFTPPFTEGPPSPQCAEGATSPLCTEEGARVEPGQGLGSGFGTGLGLGLGVS